MYFNPVYERHFGEDFQAFKRSAEALDLYLRNYRFSPVHPVSPAHFFEAVELFAIDDPVAKDYYHAKVRGYLALKVRHGLLTNVGTRPAAYVSTSPGKKTKKAASITHMYAIFQKVAPDFKARFLALVRDVKPGTVIGVDEAIDILRPPFFEEPVILEKYKKLLAVPFVNLIGEDCFEVLHDPNRPHAGLFYCRTIRPLPEKYALLAQKAKVGEDYDC